MRTQNRPLQTKHRIRMAKKRKHPRALWVAALVMIIFVSALIINSMLNQASISQPISTEPKAAIVDQLSLTYPNRTFIQTATNTLGLAGYTVDYYPGENVTVEFYRNLPTHGYRLIILRVHSLATHSQEREWPVTLFTSERYDQTRYVFEQLNGQLGKVAYSKEDMENGIIYFGIGPAFVTDHMNDRFHSSIIIVMGCEGLRDTYMAQAFVMKGAKVYISWNQEVLAAHTDLAIARLLQHFLIERQTVQRAIQKTFYEVGADPVYDSLLSAYPLEAFDYSVQDNVDSTPVTGTSEIQHEANFKKRETYNPLP